MTRFQNGPAKGQTLMLTRTPVLLRVTENGGKFDALNQPEDSAYPEEKLYCYVMAEFRGRCHINRGKHGSGFYNIVEYKLRSEQPSDEVMRHNAAWCAWCDAQLEAAAAFRDGILDRLA